MSSAPSTRWSALELATVALAQQRAQRGDKRSLRALGVVATPLELAHFALTRVDGALRDDLGLGQGLASAGLSFCDPAVGTGVWLAALLARLPQRGARAQLLGFERDAATCAHSQELLAPEAQARGVELILRCANTLELAQPWPEPERVRIVLGNPPWAARSLSRGGPLSDAWLRDFQRDSAGAPLGERRLGVLSDDYVRFFRWALEQARTAPAGAVIALVSNASFLAGPVHRGMRAALLSAFDRIEVLSLGGSALLSQGATPDEGLFPIRVSAALTIAVRRPGDQPRECQVSYGTLHGTRANKLAALSAMHVPEQRCLPRAPTFRFEPALPSEDQDACFGLHEAFALHAEGVQTNRDALVTAASREELLARLWAIARGERTLMPAPHLVPDQARQRLAQALERDAQGCVELLWYRPFEQRAFCTIAPLCHRPRPALAHAMARSPLALLSVRKEPGRAAWNMFAALPGLCDSSFLSTRSSCRTRSFPSHDAQGRPNLLPAFCESWHRRVGAPPQPVELIHYALGVLGAPGFRAAHGDQLKRDYPRLPWPRDAAHFHQTAAAGALFVTALSGPLDAGLAVAPSGPCDLARPLQRKQLRFAAPHALQLAPDLRVELDPQRSLAAAVGHHRIVERAYDAQGTCSLGRALELCTRAAMWCEAEKRAERAYQHARIVVPRAKPFALAD